MNIYIYNYIIHTSYQDDGVWHSFANASRGICAALAYLVTQFLDLKRSSKGVLQDGSRISLRLAVSSLARHHAFDEPEMPKNEEVTPTELGFKMIQTLVVLNCFVAMCFEFQAFARSRQVPWVILNVVDGFIGFLKDVSCCKKVVLGISIFYSCFGR